MFLRFLRSKQKQDMTLKISFIFTGDNSRFELKGIPDQLCYENIYKARSFVGRAAQCFRNYYLFAPFHPWCIHRVKYHGNLSHDEINNITTPWEGGTSYYKKSKLKHLCTADANSINVETIADYFSVLFMNVAFTESRFRILASMKIPRDILGKVFSMNLKFAFSDKYSWVDISVEREKIPRCQGTDNMHSNENVNLTELLFKIHNLRSVNKMYMRKHILLGITFPENISEKVQLYMETTAKYDFNNLFDTDMNRYQKLISQTYFELGKENMQYLLFVHDKIKSVRLGSFGGNSTGVVHVYGIEMCNKKFTYFQDISVQYKCYNKRDYCWYRCLNYSSAKNNEQNDNNHYYAFIYHSNIIELKKTCTRYKYVGRKWTCRGFFASRWDRNECLKGSWNEALETCAEFGGYLPIIRSKDQQDELISLLYLSKIPPPLMTIIFIGLIEYEVCHHRF